MIQHYAAPCSSEEIPLRDVIAFFAMRAMQLFQGYIRGSITMLRKPGPADDITAGRIQTTARRGYVLDHIVSVLSNARDTLSMSATVIEQDHTYVTKLKYEHPQYGSAMLKKHAFLGALICSLRPAPEDNIIKRLQARIDLLKRRTYAPKR